MTKRSVSDLALFGGPVSFQQPLHVGHVDVAAKARFLRYVDAAFEGRRLTNDGPLVRELERRVADFLGVRHCIATCNGTMALQIAIRALGMQGEVLLPSLTFVATAHALAWQGITAVFCDVQRDTHLLDPAAVADALSSAIGGVIGVHLWGRVCDVEALVSHAQRHQIPVLFDAAHAFGASRGRIMAGNFGDAEVFSFHATKFFHTFEGGAVVTNDGDLAERLALLRNHGFAGVDKVSLLGINAKMSEISAAMGLAGLDDLALSLARNQDRYQAYADRLDGVDGLDLVRYDEAEHNNYQYLVLEVAGESPGLSRDQLVRLLHAENVLARRYFHPGCHRIEPYASLDPGAGQRLRNTELISDRVLALPTGAALDQRDLDRVCQLLLFAIEHGREIATRLQHSAHVPAPSG